MSKQKLKEVVWRFPHAVRRPLISLAYPKICKRMSQMEKGFLGEHSLLPFFEKEVIYIHIPKVAGISVSEGLFGNQSAGHQPMRLLENYLGEEKIRDWKRVTFVRDPWDRVYSAYRFLTVGGINERDEKIGRKISQQVSNFEEFILKWMTPARVFDNVHLRPQAWFLKSVDGAIKMDFIGRFESLESDYELLTRDLGFGNPLPKLNVTTTKKKSLDQVYTDEMVERVGLLYREDIEAFDYCYLRP